MPKKKGDIILEFHKVKKVTKVTAIDTTTGREVSIVGDSKATKKQLTELAVRKLQYVLERDTKPHG